MIKQLPQNIEAEKAVLGSIILRPKSLLEVSSIITPDSFYQSKNGKIFEICLKLHKENTPIDMLSLSKEGIEVSYLTELVSSVPSSTNIKYYAEEVAKTKTLRDVIEIGSKISEVGFKEDYENIPVVLSELQKRLVNKKIKQDNILETFNEFDKRTEEYQEKKRLGIDLIGISCGYPKIDKVIDGLRKGHFWVLGGFSNLGKTTLALNIVSDLIKQGKRVIYYSLEMTDVDTVSRLLGIMSEDNGLSIIKGYAKDKNKVNEMRQKIIDSGFLVKTGLSELSEIMMSMYEENIKSPVDLFVIDYIQNMKVKGAKSEYETTTITAVELQLNAQRLGIPTIALSQISNEGAKNGDYQLVAGFKGSGAINASADLAMEIKIGEKNNEERVEKIKRGEKVNMKLMIVKNRHGSVGYVDLMFDGSTGIFQQELSLDERF
jgi:replicative DNA helicase